MRPLYQATMMAVALGALSMVTSCSGDFAKLVGCDCSQYKDEIAVLEHLNKKLEKELEAAKLEQGLRAKEAELEQHQERLRDLEQDQERLRLQLEAAQAERERRDANAAGIEEELARLRQMDASDGQKPGDPPYKPAPAQLRDQLEAVNREAKECGEDGSLTVSFTLTPEGDVKDAKPIAGSFVGTDTEKCILSILEKSHFSPFTGPQIPVKYPFKL